METLQPFCGKYVRKQGKGGAEIRAAGKDGPVDRDTSVLHVAAQKGGNGLC